MDTAGCSRMQGDFVGDFFPNVGDLSLMLVTFLAFLIRSTPSNFKRNSFHDNLYFY